MPRKLETIRRELEAAHAELARLESPLLLRPQAEALAAADAFVDQCAARAREHIEQSAPAFATRSGHRPGFLDDGGLYSHAAVMARMQDGLALLAADALRAELHAAVSALYEGADAMPEDARCRAVDELRVRIARLEREEFDACTAAGLPLRAGTRPELLLGLE